MLNVVSAIQVINKHLVDFYTIKPVQPIYVYHGIVNGEYVGNFSNKFDCQKTYHRIASTISNSDEIIEYKTKLSNTLKSAIINILYDIEQELKINIPSLKKDSLAIHFSLLNLNKVTTNSVLEFIDTIVICFN